MSENYKCPNCGSLSMSVFYELEKPPVHSVLLLPTREEALHYPCGDIVLGFCHTCGFIANVAFNPALHEYSSKYEATQGFSPTFNVFHRRLAQELIGRYDLHHKDIIEIGCGQGEFLTMLCELGENRGIGFDPAYIPERMKSEAKERITFIQDFYSEKYAAYKADFICCKMTLEHIQNTADFISAVRRSIGDQLKTIVFFQVPDITRILRDLAFWDIYYEHCSYFSPVSLTYLFRKCGFNIIDVRTEYEGQYLIIEATPDAEYRTAIPVQEDELAQLRRDVTYFVDHYQQRLAAWQQELEKINQNGQRAVIWGAGSKGVTFLTTLKIRDQIRYAIDINPYKHGTYMAGTGQEIVAPEFLQLYKPDIVIVMNPIYCEEIQQILNKLGITAKLMPV